MEKMNITQHSASTYLSTWGAEGYVKRIKRSTYAKLVKVLI